MRSENKPFLDEVIKRNLLPEKEVMRIIMAHRDHYQVLLHVIHNGLMRQSEACRLWADSLGVALMDLNETLFQPEVVERMSKKFARENIVAPIYQLGDRVTVAMADATNKSIIEDVEKHLKAKISVVFSMAEDILDAIEIQFIDKKVLEDISGKFDVSMIPINREIGKAELEKLAGDNSIIELGRSLMLLAIKDSASDIHIEPMENNILIRFRIDGVLSERLRLSLDLMAPLVSRIKILSGMDITERRRPQDGRLTMELANRSISFRVSTAPTIHGEKTVLRLLGQIQKRNIPQIEELYFSKEIYDWIKQLIKAPSGAFFITGPTGSGKTTTLFSALQRVNTPELNIMTIEDPVEYRLEGANQVQVNPSVGLTFSTALRAFLRQDPDIMLIGEIRDIETAKIATEAALTGHLVFSTLHTNDAIQAVTRLVEIGVEPFLVGPSLIGVMSQRLVRRICDSCKESYALPKEEVERLFICDAATEVKMWRGKGCAKCRFTGYSGRLGIHEMILVDDELRKLIIANAPLPEIKKAAVKTGYKTMRYDGLKKALRGLTTLEEVEEATFSPYA
ncbi:MAG: type II/IV secretion system protein [Nitrospinae bacterium]|nr:type II/IV secretion system protein [Nitrospinota bacterium]